MGAQRTSLLSVVSNDNAEDLLNASFGHNKSTVDNIVPYVFVSFDLCNSTKLKTRTELWLDIIKRFINSRSFVTSELDLWKFNGDELLYTKELVSVQQLIKIMQLVYQAVPEIRNSLRGLLAGHPPSRGIDLIDVKATIWMAGISTSGNHHPSNCCLSELGSLDFSGTNIDEGFRLTKCTTRNKVAIDPKIALLLTAYAVLEFSNETTFLTKITTILKNPHNVNDSTSDFSHAFAQFWQDNEDSLKKIKAEIKVCADNLRIVGYSHNKGVWDERPYPVIWYSESWTGFQEDILYDEEFNSVQLYNNKIWESFYNDNKNGVENYAITFNMLYKICTNVSYMSNAICDILKSKLQGKSPTLNTRKATTIDRMRLYSMTVCVCRETKGAIIFRRDDRRGHLPGVWDLVTQKYIPIQTNNFRLDCLNAEQIQDMYLQRYGLAIKVLIDENRQAIKPIAIRPVYRRKELSTGILCFAEIDLESMHLSDDKGTIEKQILSTIKSNLDKDTTEECIPFYSDVAFVHMPDIRLDKQEILLSGATIRELKYEEEYDDSTKWDQDKNSYDGKSSVAGLTLAVKEAFDFYLESENTDENG